MSDTQAENTSTQSARATRIIRAHMIASIAGGIIPLPLLDAGVVVGVQLRMISRLASLYGVEYSEQRSKAIIAALAGVGVELSAGTVLKALFPAARLLVGLGSLAAIPATTYALGELFRAHFESGGTIWTFDPARDERAFKKKVEEGKRVVTESYAGIRP